MSDLKLAGSMYVDGSWRDGSGAPIDVIDPATEDVVARVPSAGADDVEAALASSRRAQKAWAREGSVARGAYLRELADLIHANAGRLAELLSLEMGKPASEAAAELEFAEGLVRYSAEWDRRLEGEVLPGETGRETVHLLRAPLGVVAAICPWNFPLAVLCRKLAPALLTGNTVVAKPSEISPLSSLELVRLIDENLDLPAGVFNLVCGAGETGAAMVRSPHTAMVSFTGHRDTGKRIMAEAAGDLTRVALELGGKAPAIVWRDADLDVAVPALVEARFTNAGQVCTSAERVFVHADLVEDFTDRYVAAAESLVLGGASAGAGVQMGPLSSAAQLEKVTAAVERAVGEGAQVLTGGGRPEGDGGGYFFSPTVLGGIRPEMDVMREETFGPVAPIIGVDALDEVLEYANDSRYGLSAYLFSRDYPTVMRAVEELEFGEIYINRTLGETVHAHHSGYKESGIGGEDGKWGLTRYTQIKTAYHRYG
jgi:lactaldehyde dehydrogenase/glycolaldehyde dehydrogenase